MNETRIEVDGKVFWFKIGLRGIIYLQELSQINVESWFIAGIMTLQPEMTSSAILSLWARFKDTDQGEQLYKDYFLPSKNYSINISVRDLYSQMVGELGISPAIFFQMSPEECELAYKGYLKRQMLAANLNKLAYAQIEANNYDEIDILPPEEYINGNIQERENTFSVLEMNSNDDI